MSSGNIIRDMPLVFDSTTGALVGHVDLNGREQPFQPGSGAQLQAGALTADGSVAPNAQAVVQAINGLQPALTAGANITIDPTTHVISATGTGGGTPSVIDGGSPSSSTSDVVDGGTP